MKTLEATGKTYEEALMAGLAQMGLPSDKVDVEVLEEGSKGFLGIGAKPYRLRLTKKDTPALRAEEFLQNVTELMGLDVVLDVQDEEEALRIEMQGDNQGILIGHRGETLDALQYLTSLLVNKGGKDYRRVTLDTEGYRAKREQTLINLANRMAAKVQRSGRRMVLEPMNPYERRILHATLQDNPHVTTHSEGRSPTAAWSSRPSAPGCPRREGPANKPHTSKAATDALRRRFFERETGERGYKMEDTIASIATAVGLGGIAIIRVSGPRAKDILSRVFRPHRANRAMTSHRLTYGEVREGERRVDECMAVYMKAPHTYTTEDVVEFQCHGGAVTAQEVLAAVLRAGARLAEPGEFTKRAFLGGRIDLAQAESVMDLISARTARAAHASLQQMDGYLSRRIHALQDKLLDTIAYLEATLDYPDEDIEPLTARRAAEEARAVQTALQEAVRNARAGRLLSAGVRIVLAGSPNTGKSSLLNCLLREQRAIVTDVAGTTRDVLREELDLFGLPVQLSDTAGLRSAEDAVERIGIDRAREELRRADVALLVLDSARELTPEERSLLRETSVPLVVALNKTDLNARTGVEDVRAALQGAQAFAILLTSAVTGEGIEDLRRALYEAALRGASPEEAYLTNERHVQAARTPWRPWRAL